MTGAPRALALASDTSSPCEEERSSGRGGEMGAMCIACLFSPAQAPAIPAAPPPRVEEARALSTPVFAANVDPAPAPAAAEFFHPPKR
jgi:hypothetical protein